MSVENPITPLYLLLKSFKGQNKTGSNVKCPALTPLSPVTFWNHVLNQAACHSVYLAMSPQKGVYEKALNIDLFVLPF